MSDNPVIMTFEEQARTLRHRVKALARDVRGFQQLNLSNPQACDQAELAANLALSYRHLEDASMRIGKAMQAFDGGASVYDDSTTGQTQRQ